MLSRHRRPPEDEEMRAYRAQPDFHLSILRYLVVSSFFVYGLPWMEAFPAYLRDLVLWDFLFDFKGHAPKTFAFYTLLYLFFYQGLIVNAVAFCFIAALRNFLERYVYKNTSVTNPSNESAKS
jgi:hypothetical protein